MQLIQVGMPNVTLMHTHTHTHAHTRAHTHTYIHAHRLKNTHIHLHVHFHAQSYHLSFYITLNLLSNIADALYSAIHLFYNLIELCTAYMQNLKKLYIILLDFASNLQYM